MFKLTTNRTGQDVLINLDNVELLQELEGGDTLVLFTSSQKIYLAGDVESNMTILGLKSGK